MATSTHSMVIMRDGTVKGAGNNGTGQLGIGNTTSPITAFTALSLAGVKQVSIGRQHSIFLMQDGSIKGVGMNAYGQLGMGDNTNRLGTVATSSVLSGVKQVASGDDHALYLMNDGTVKACGQNDNGQLGLGNTTNPILTPTTIPGITGVKAVACGRNFSFLIMQDGSVKAMGQNNESQLGLGNATTPVTSPTNVSAVSNVKQIAGGYGHTVFVMNDGSVKVVGRGATGQLGLGNTNAATTVTANPNLSNVKQADCGAYFSAFLLNDGTVKTVGDNSMGQLGNGGTSQQTSPYTTSLTGVVSIACGYGHTAAVLQDGSIRLVGHNEYGQMGNGATVASPGATTTWHNPSATVTTAKNLWGAMLKLLKLLIQSGDKYYTYASGWSELVGELTEAVFKASGMDSIASIPVTAYALLTDPQVVAFTDDAAPQIEIEGHKDYLALCGSPVILGWTDDVVPLQVAVSGQRNLFNAMDGETEILGYASDSLSSAVLTVAPKPTLVMPTGDLRLDGVSSIDRFTLTAIKSGNGVVKVIVSVDRGVTWKTYNGGWLTITTDQAATAGMTPEAMGALTSVEWAALRGSSDTIRFAYYLEVSSPTDTAATDKLESQFDMEGHWVVAGDSRYRVDYSSRTKMMVSLYQDGSYKINYA